MGNKKVGRVNETKKVAKNASNSVKMGTFKRLFFDIETSYCQGWFWGTGYDVTISNDQILKPSAIICICYKWGDSNKIHSLHWDKGNDRQMILDFVKILSEADEVVSHNGDKFDIKWFRTRCLLHGIKSIPNITSTDTLKIARQKFRLSSNRLNDIGEILGLGGKIDTGGIQLWHDIIQDNNKDSLNKMIRYCKRDVELLEKVYNYFRGYSVPKVHAGAVMGLGSCSCPTCASTNYSKSRNRITASGIMKVQLQCKNCGKYWTISQKQFENNSIEQDKV